MRDTILIIDTFSHLHRAYHALPDLRTNDNQPTGAVYGVIQMLDSLKKQYPAKGGVCVFDSPGKTFRHRLYPLYKANRGEPDPDFIKQIQPLIACIEASGWHCLRMDGTEADDLIGSLAQHLTQRGYHCLISTGDKDLAQLVNDHVTLINTMSGEYLDEDRVKKKFGVSPKQIVDYLSLIGDSSDNIPGVYKVGPKTAQKWIAQYECLETLLSQKDSIPGVIGNNLRAAVEQLMLNKKLITIQCDLPLEQEEQDFPFRESEVEKLRVLYQNLGFTSLLKKLPDLKCDACDQDFVPLPPTPDQLFIIAEKVKDTNTYRCSYHVDEKRVQEQLMDADEVKTLLMGSKNIVGHNLKALCHQIGCCLPSSTCLDDIGLMFYLLQPQKKNDWKTLYNNQEMDTPALKRLYDLWTEYSMALEDNPPLKALYEQVERPLQYCLLKMELTGVLIDVDHLTQQGEAIDQQLKQCTKTIHCIAGEEFNIQSTQQLQTILFEKLALPVSKKTPKGTPSTDEEVLHQLAKQYEIAQHLLRFRTLSKIKSTYIEGLLAKVDHKTQRIHTTYCQTTTITGRLSSIEPNLQNIPIRTPEGKMIRAAFVVPKGSVLLSADYSQIELRLMAHLSRDPALCHAFHEGKDIHQATAAEVLHKAIDTVTPEERRWAKAINFGLIYGMSSFGLGKQLDISRQDAQFFIDRYFERYPDVAAFMEEVKKFARAQGYVETIFGRRLWLPDIQSRRIPQRTAAERTAINAPLQGSAADLIKMAMVQLNQQLQDKKSKIIMQVHDELVLEVAQEEKDEVEEMTRTTMISAARLHVPLEVSIHFGPHWEKAH